MGQVAGQLVFGHPALYDGKASFRAYNYKMSDVQFEGEDGYQSGSFRSRVVFGQSVTPAMVRLIMKSGMVKDEKKAGAILVFFFIFALAASVGIFIWNGGVGRSRGTDLKTGSGESLGLPIND